MQCHKNLFTRENFNRELCVPNFFEKFYLERCKNLANDESRGILQSRGILLDNPAILRDLVNCILHTIFYCAVFPFLAHCAIRMAKMVDKLVQWKISNFQPKSYLLHHCFIGLFHFSIWFQGSQKFSPIGLGLLSVIIVWSTKKNVTQVMMVHA